MPLERAAHRGGAHVPDLVAQGLDLGIARRPDERPQLLELHPRDGRCTPSGMGFWRVPTSFTSALKQAADKGAAEAELADDGFPRSALVVGLNYAFTDVLRDGGWHATGKRNVSGPQMKLARFYSASAPQPICLW